jgi:hypothetical protein
MRVYVPTTLNGLAAAHAGAGLGPAPLRAYAVTPALREWYVSDDLEELEYAALTRAAQASLRLLHADAKAPRRRVVLSADIPDQLVELEPEAEVESIATLGAVRLLKPLPLSEVASVHLDADDAEQDVTAAADAVAAADAGDEDAHFTVDGAEDHELLWFATQEIPALLP